MGLVCQVPFSLDCLHRESSLVLLIGGSNVGIDTGVANVIVDVGVVDGAADVNMYDGVEVRSFFFLTNFFFLSGFEIVSSGIRADDLDSRGSRVLISPNSERLNSVKVLSVLF